MNQIKIFLLIICLFLCSYGQTDNKPIETNLGFEKITEKDKLPDNWRQWGSKDYLLKIDNINKRSGNNSILIESSDGRTAGAFGGITHSLQAFIGKEIELRGFLKLKDVSDGFAGLFLRIDDENGGQQFNNMQDQKINGSSDWTEYSIKLKLPEEGETIYFGAINTGKGQVWADDFQILIDGKDISEAKPKPIPKAKLDKEFDTGSRITSINLTSAKTEDLVVLGKVWGFLKYHHPAIVKGDYNWDYELFRILPKIISAKNKNERNSVLESWIESLGSFEKGENEKIEPNKIKLNPDFSWLNEKTLGKKLTESLQNVRNAKRTNKSYYIGLFPNVGNPVFKNENSYKAMNYPDVGFRLLGLYRYWNIIQYYFPNKHLIEEDWNKVLNEFVPKFVNTKNETEYVITSLKLIGRIHDTHANLSGRNDVLDKFRGVNYAPVKVDFIENKAVVTKYWEQALGEKSGLKIGDAIETINGKNVTQIVKESLEYNPASNYPTKLRDIANHLLRTNENKLKVKFKRGNEINEIIVECFPKETLKNDVIKLFQKQVPPFKLISPDIAYLYPGSLKRGEISNLFVEISKTKGLIVDLRSYPSDFIVFSLSEFLLPTQKSFVKFSTGSITKPGLFTFTDELKVGNENKNYYQGKVVILINELTQSQAEYTTMALRTSPRATVIGSTTAGADGNISEFSLPGGISTWISGIGVYYPDGKETQRIGILPDIEVKPTIKGIAEGRDELLEKAIEIIKSN